MVEVFSCGNEAVTDEGIEWLVQEAGFLLVKLEGVGAGGLAADFLLGVVRFLSRGFYLGEVGW